jgi:hypothetical protein
MAFYADVSRPAQQRLNDAFREMRRVLTDSGVVHGAQVLSEAEIVNDAAQTLAEASDHPRYGDGGWRRLTESLADVQVAYLAATAERRGPMDDATLVRLSRARHVLTSHIGRKRREANQ